MALLAQPRQGATRHSVVTSALHRLEVVPLRQLRLVVALHAQRVRHSVVTLALHRLEAVPEAPGGLAYV